MTFRFLLMFLLVSPTINGQLIRNQYYFLERPSSNIFSKAFGEPDGKSDPVPGPSSSNITDDDLTIENSTFSESFYSDKSNTSSYLFGTWSRVKGINVTGRFSKVKHVVLKNESWQKITDNLYHVVEALKADTVELKIKKELNNSITSDVIQKITSLFTTDYTVVGKVLSALGNDDSTNIANEGKNSIVKFKYSSSDSISLLIIDTTVYYAVRYAKIDPSMENVVTILGLKTNRLRAPVCAPEMKKDPRPVVPKDMNGKTSQLLMPECKINNAVLSIRFVHDPDKQLSNVIIIRKRPNQVVSRTTNSAVKQQVIDTVYISEYIDFEDTYKDESFMGFYPFVANENPNSNTIENIVVACDYKIAFNNQKRELLIFNYQEKQYQSCFYYETAKIKFFPK